MTRLGDDREAAGLSAARRLRGTVLALVALFMLAACSQAPFSSEPQLRVRLIASEESSVTGFEVSFVSVVTGASGPVEFEWGPGTYARVVADDGGVASLVFLRPGTHQVWLTVRDGDRSASANVNVQVLDPPHYGEWIWVVMFDDGFSYGGAFSVLLGLRDDEDWSDSSAGIWSWAETPAGIGSLYGEGMVGTLEDDWVFGLFDTSNQMKLVAIDADGQVGTEFDGAPSFWGVGTWFYDNGTEEIATVGMKWIGRTTLFQYTSVASDGLGLATRSASLPRVGPSVGTSAGSEDLARVAAALGGIERAFANGPGH